MKRSIVVWCTLMLFIAVGTLKSQVLINEFMAFNVSTYPDMCDYDDFSSWIELANTSDSAISLSGYYLTDNFTTPTKWPLPSDAKIPAKGFLVIRADGADAKPGKVDTLDSYPWSEKFTTKRYHTNFKLSAEGEEIGLYKSNGYTVSIVDSVVFVNQLADVSLGRNPVKTGWFRYDQPTPGAANSTSAKTVELLSGAVSYSIPGGFYNEAQNVMLTTGTGEIFYTVDGSVPNKNSLLYSSPIAVGKTTVIRARCIDGDKLAGKIATNTYFIQEPKHTLMMASITTDTTFLYSKELGIFENSWKNREVPIAMELFTPEGKQVVKVNAGMTLGSLTNFTCPQKPLQIALKGGKYGDDFIWYRLFDKEIACFPRIRLRQGGDGWETNLITDGMLESMSKNQLEFGIQAYRPVILFINGKYYGIHDMREQFDDQYFTNNYNVDPTSKTEVKSTFAPLPNQTKEVWETVSGNWEDYHSLIDLVTSKSSGVTAETYASVKEQINVNSLVDFVSAVVYACQISWGHNEDIWRVASTKWQWLVTDFDRCFVYKSSMSDVKTNNFTKGAGVSGSIMKQDTLFSNLLSNSEFKSYFTQRFAAHLNSTFSPSRMIAIVDSLAAILSPEMDTYTAKWGVEGGIGSTAKWIAQVDSVKRYIMERPGYVFDFFKETPFSYTGTSVLTINIPTANSGEIYINGVKMCAGIDSLRFVTGVPLTIKAVARQGYVFAGWNDQSTVDTMTLTLTKNQTVTARFEVSGQHVVTSPITKNTTFNLTDNPYVSAGDIIVEKGVTLTIEKGVTLLMSQNADILIKGKLLVNGTADARVTLQHNSGTGATTWGALNFLDATDTSKLSYVTLSGTTLGNDPLNQRAGINGNGSNVILENLIMSQIVYPLYFEYSHVELRNSSITIDHICNGGIHIGRGSGIVENNFWQSTGKTINTDAIDIKGVTECLIRNNRLYNFNGFNSDGIDLGEKALNVSIIGNYIYGNRDKGISVGGGSNAILHGNIVVGCDLGIGIKDEGSKATINHCAFIRNRIAVAAYSKVYGRGGGTAVVNNSILSSSKARSFYVDQFSNAEFSFCVSDVDVLPGTGNLTGDPAFIDQFTNNFQLYNFSICLNNGHPGFPADPDGSRPDIGPNYTFNTNDFPATLAAPVLPPKVVISEIMYNNDKDFNSGDWLELHNPGTEPISLANWKITDQGDYLSWEAATDIGAVDSEDVYYFPPSATIPAGGYLVLCEDSINFIMSYPTVPNLYGSLPFGLKAGETLFLYNHNDALVNTVTYRSSSPWPKKPDGDGPSLELIRTAGLNYHPLNWNASKGKGTPGAVNTASGIAHHPVALNKKPSNYALLPAFPNPCKVQTNIRFALPQNDKVSIALYNLSGCLLETLFDDNLESGYHTVMLNAKKYAPGVYFYRIKTNRFVKTNKLTIQ